MGPDLLTGGFVVVTVLDETGSSAPFGREIEGAVGVGSEGSAVALVLFFAGGFLVASFVAESEDSVTDEGSWAVDVDEAPCPERIP